jgi:signal transduction histidine kinase
MDRYLAAPLLPALDPGELFALLADAYIILSEDLRVVHVNESYLRLTHTTSAQLIGRSIFELNEYAPAQQRAARDAVIRNTLSGLNKGETRSSEFFRFDLSRPDEPRVPRFWKIKASVIAPAAQPGVLFAVRLTDVTRRVEKIDADQREKARLRSQAQLRRVVADEAQTRLQESLERFGRVLDFAKVGAWELDFATGEINCTDQCKLNVGIDVTERLNEHRLFSELIDPADSGRVQHALTEAVRRRSSFEVEYRLKRPGGPQQWTMVGGHPHYDDAGTPIKMTGFTLDITSRKLAELEQQEIAHIERQAREASEHYARAMDHFLAAVSHELRSPIGVILNWTSVLERARDLSLAVQAGTTIQRNAKQLALMVDDLLDTGAIVSGKLRIKLSTVRLDVLTGDIVSDLRAEVERKGLVLLDEGLAACEMTGDESRIKQIVWNLMTNAIKFTDSGRIVVSLVSQGREALMSIRDTGRGIEPAAIDRIFGRFEQICPERSGRVGGLGLGLWLVKNLVEQHGGRIEAQSAGLGHGSTFRVFFPLNT